MDGMGKKAKKRAAALKYDPLTSDAPVLAAYGEGYVAEKIVETAGKSGVPVVRDAPLAAALQRVDVGDEIPEEIYEVVARILLFVSETDSLYERSAGRASAEGRRNSLASGRKPTGNGSEGGAGG
jgi:flagellar biosynthesis protein